MRQDGDRALDRAPSARASGPYRGRRGTPPGPGPPGGLRRDDAAGARPRDLDDLSGADGIAESGGHGGPPDIGGVHSPRAHVPARRMGAHRGRAPAGAHSRAGAARERVSPPALRRHEPARDDRDGPCLQPEGPACRRAHHRARRDRPGADPRPDDRAQGEARHRDRADHPRHGDHRRECESGRGDVCRTQGRGGRGRGAVLDAVSSLYVRTAGLDPAPRQRGRQHPRAPAGNCRHRALASRRRAGMRVRAALLVRR